MKRLWLFLWGIALCAALSACVTTQLGTIHPPPATAKLRVAVLPITSQAAARPTNRPERQKWGKNKEEFSEHQYQLARQIIGRLGYYEVVAEEEMAAVLEETSPDRLSLTRNDSALARRLGGALYADYLLLVERGALDQSNFFFELTLMNLESGRNFGVRINHVRGRGENKLPEGTGKAAFRELFADAKGDLLATAWRKSGRLANPAPEPAATGPEGKQPSAAQADSLPRAEPAAPGGATGQVAPEPRAEPQLAGRQAGEAQLAAAGLTASGSRVVEYREAEEGEEGQVAGRRRLLVYDLAAPDHFRPVALILSEALREEIQKRGRYNLVNRENLEQLLAEMKFQQSGLVDSAQAVEAGKGAGAQEIVTGNFGALGRTVILQSKRTELHSLLNLSQASLQSEAGQEDRLLPRLTAMVDQLLVNK